MKIQSDMPAWSSVLFEPHRFKVIYGGRGSSKSWSAAMALVLQAMNERHFIVCIREVQLSIRDSSKRVLEAMIEMMGVGSLFRITDNYIKCVNTGSAFIFKGLQDKGEGLRSAEGATRAWVDEASTISQDSLDNLIPTIRAPGSEIWITFNPNLPTDPVYEMFVATDNPPPRSAVLKVNHTENPWFPQDLKDKMQWDRARDPDKYRHVWEGEPVEHSEAQIFHGYWRIEPCPEPPYDAMFYHGADWGFANDPTVLVRAWIDGQTLYIPDSVYGYGTEIKHTPALFDRVEGAKDWPIVADSARPELISHMQQHGYPKMHPTSKGAASVVSGIKFLQDFDIVIDPRNKELIDEFSLYKYKINKHTAKVTPIIEDRNNHGIDALRYALEPAMRMARRGPKMRVA